MARPELEKHTLLLNTLLRLLKKEKFAQINFQKKKEAN